MAPRRKRKASAMEPAPAAAAAAAGAEEPAPAVEGAPPADEGAPAPAGDASMTEAEPAPGGEPEAAEAEQEQTEEQRQRAEADAARREAIDAEIADLEAELETIASGNHPELKARFAVLDRTKLRRETAAEAFRKLQTENIQSLYEFEMQEAAHVNAQARSNVQERLKGALDDRKRRLQEARDGGGSLESLEARANTRSLRSKNKGDDDDGGSGAPSAGSGTRSGTRAAKKGAAAADANPLSMLLASEGIHEDLAAIHRDWREQARKRGAVAAHAVRTERGKLIVDEQQFDRGDPLVVVSDATAEEFYGTLTSCNTTEVFLRLADGTRCRVYLAHLRNGRCTVRADSAGVVE